MKKEKGIMSDKSNKENYERLRVCVHEFPKEEVFKTKKEVDEYFSKDRIQCLLCGKRYKKLGGAHLQIIHDITEDEYREKYGLPYTRGLVCPSTSKKLSIITKKRYDNGEIGLLTHESARRARVNSTKPRKNAPYITNELEKRCLEWCKQTARSSEDYNKVLIYIKKYKITIERFCDQYKHLRLPSQSRIRNRIQTNPDYGKRYYEIIYAWPYNLQSKYRCLSPRFFKTVFKLFYKKKLTKTEISQQLGVSLKCVWKAITTCKYKGQDLTKYKPVIEK